MGCNFSTFPIFKVSAAGNDFLLVDLLSASHRELWQSEYSKLSRAQLTRRWCDRFTSLGADGVVFLEPDGACDFKWDFYNSNGGNAEMCGNAARAVSLYVARTTEKSKLVFNTRAGLVRSWVRAANDIEIQLPRILDIAWHQSAQQNSIAVAYDFVRSGVPHAVVTVSDIKDRGALRRLIPAIKNEPRFAADGVNVTFVQPLATPKIASVTFERGVEDFTQACGTGAVAAAFSVLRGEEQRKIEVQVPGGTLFVVWKEGQPHLSGPAQIVAEIHLHRGETECL